MNCIEEETDGDEDDVAEADEEDGVTDEADTENGEPELLPLIMVSRPNQNPNPCRMMPGMCRQTFSHNQVTNSDVIFFHRISKRGAEAKKKHPSCIQASTTHQYP